jgi:YgiT-type zinc finger domain-containing protein
MIGERAARNRGICAVCGGGLGKATTNIPFVRGDRLFLVKGVPAEVCGDCGEAYLDGPTLDRALAMVKGFEAADAEFSVARYRAA